MALAPSCPEGCIDFSGERLGRSAYRARKSARNGLRANETLGARLKTSRRTSRSRNLPMNVRIAPVVTDSIQELNEARAPLTVFAPSRMVALNDQGERMMANVTQSTLETSAAIQHGCQR
jgi:hypothetical protein